MYKTLYIILFNAITDALEKISHGAVSDAVAILKAAQQQTEALYMESGED